MSFAVRFEERVEVPLGIGSLADFRAWAISDTFPESGRIDYLDGFIEVDMSPEDLHTHGKVKLAIASSVWFRVEQEELGEAYTDRARISCPDADLSAEPDVVFVSEESLAAGRVRLVPKVTEEPDRYVELEGPPDLVVEIVSDSSVGKDTRRLPAAYYRAGVPEFWLVDARGSQLVFRIHRRGPKRYQPVTPDTDGFQPSSVLHRSYRLIRGRNRAGRVTFRLEEREGRPS